MKRLPFLLLLVLSPLVLLGRDAEKPNTVLVHPGEVIYARFAENGKRLKLLGYSKEADEKAQLILTIETNPKNETMTLKLQNRFTKDMTYRVEMRSLSKNVRLPVTTYPVVTEKVSLDPLLPKTEEVAVFGFELIL